MKKYFLDTFYGSKNNFREAREKDKRMGSKKESARGKNTRAFDSHRKRISSRYT